MEKKTKTNKVNKEVAEKLNKEAEVSQIAIPDKFQFTKNEVGLIATALNNLQIGPGAPQAYMDRENVLAKLNGIATLKGWIEKK